MSGSEIIVVVVKCFKPAVDLPNLGTLLDTILRQQGYKVKEVIVRIEEVDDVNSGKITFHSSG